jgi:Ala-tRNA(Pro) deacylase
MRNKTLEKFLDDHHVKYDLVRHSITYTAPETAAAAHISGKQLAKSVVVRLDGKLALVVLPAHSALDLKEFKEQLKAGKLELAHEYEFQDKFKGCELGAIPPIGELFNIDVYLDERLTSEDEIAFNAGTHSELIKLSLKDFEKLVKPKHLYH